VVLFRCFDDQFGVAVVRILAYCVISRGSKPRIYVYQCVYICYLESITYALKRFFGLDNPECKWLEYLGIDYLYLWS
jgi:hypothetical protein